MERRMILDRCLAIRGLIEECSAHDAPDVRHQVRSLMRQLRTAQWACVAWRVEHGRHLERVT
jgi:hypothetical protein